jgi:hypothetical protein
MQEPLLPIIARDRWAGPSVRQSLQVLALCVVSVTCAGGRESDSGGVANSDMTGAAISGGNAAGGNVPSADGSSGNAPVGNESEGDLAPVSPGDAVGSAAAGGSGNEAGIAPAGLDGTAGATSVAGGSRNQRRPDALLVRAAARRQRRRVHPARDPLRQWCGLQLRRSRPERATAGSTSSRRTNAAPSCICSVELA